MIILIPRDSIQVGIFTVRRVQVKEELCYDYMLEHLGSEENARAYKCLCGSAKCRGLMAKRRAKTTTGKKMNEKDKKK